MASAEPPLPARLQIRGLPRELLDDELRARFAPFGEVSSVEVLREKPNSPFFRRDGVGSSSESESDDVLPGKAGRGGRGKAQGGRGRGRGGVPKKNAHRNDPKPPPPCRGFAYVTLLAKDVKSLTKCVTTYNGCKWKGGLLTVNKAKPRWHELQTMERDGTDELGVSLKGTKANAKGEPQSKDSVERNAEFLPLKVGDELEIDSKVRHEKVVVLVGKGAKQHVIGEGQFPDEKSHQSDWSEFPESASWKSMRKVSQLPEIELQIKQRALATEKRYERRRERMLARLGRDKDTMEEVEWGDDSYFEGDSEASGDEYSEDSEYSDDKSKKSKKPDRFALPREFFASASAALRAADNADSTAHDDSKDGELKSANKARERFGLGPASMDNAYDTNPRKRKDTVELRALAAFLGGDSDSDDEKVPSAGKQSEVPALQEKKTVKTVHATSKTASKPAPIDPDEGGVPMGNSAAKWWEKASDEKDEKGEDISQKKTKKGDPASKRLKPEKDPVPDAAISRDFFRASTAAFVPFGLRSVSLGHSSDSGRESAEEGAEKVSASDSDGISLSEDKLLQDWQGEESSDEDMEDDDDDDVDSR